MDAQYTAVMRLSLPQKMLFLLIPLAVGCQLVTQAITSPDPSNTSNNLELLDIPSWSRISTEGLPSTAAHLGGVLAVRETAKAPLQVISAGKDGNMVAWNLASGEGSLVKALGTVADLVAFGESHSLIAWSSGRTITVACLAGCAAQWQLSSLKTKFTSIAFHENDSALLIGGADSRVYRWRFMAEKTAQTIKEREKILERYIVHQTAITKVASLRAGRAFLSADWDGALYAWLAYTADDQNGSFDKNLFGGRFFGNVGTYLGAARNRDRGITSLSVSDDSSRIALGTEDGYVEIWEVRGFEMIARKATHNGRVTGISLNSSGTRVASVGRDGHIEIADIARDPSYKIKPGSLAYQCIPVLSDEMKSVSDITFVSSGDAIVTTLNGQLGEIKINSTIPGAAPTPPIQEKERLHSGDSDY